MSRLAGPFDLTTAPSKHLFLWYSIPKSWQRLRPVASSTCHIANAQRTPSTNADVPRIIFLACSGDATATSSLIFVIWWHIITEAPVSVATCASKPVSAAPAAGSEFTSAWTKEASGSNTINFRFCICIICAYILSNSTLVLYPSLVSCSIGNTPPTFGKDTTLISCS